MNSGIFSLNSLLVHSLLCQITHSFLNAFHPNLCQHFSHVRTYALLVSPRSHLTTFSYQNYKGGHWPSDKAMQSYVLVKICYNLFYVIHVRS